MLNTTASLTTTSDQVHHHLLLVCWPDRKFAPRLYSNCVIMTGLTEISEECLQHLVESVFFQRSTSSSTKYQEAAEWSIMDRNILFNECLLPQSSAVPEVFHFIFSVWWNVLFLDLVFSPSATRKKLFEIARTFSEKTKRRKSKRKVLLKHHSYPSP